MRYIIPAIDKAPGLCVGRLPKEDFWNLSDWVIQRHGTKWDQEIEGDIWAGKLERFAEEALREDREGKTRPFPE